MAPPVGASLREPRVGRAGTARVATGDFDVVGTVRAVNADLLHNAPGGLEGRVLRALPPGDAGLGGSARSNANNDVVIPVWRVRR